MHVRRHKKQAAFTIIELLIVIVVIGVLAAITIISYSGMQMRADNAVRQGEAIAWRKSFEAYKAAYGNYPVMADGGYCLGSGSQNGYCRVYSDQYSGSYKYAEVDDVPLMNELQKISTIPSGTRQPINNTIGPWVMYFPGNIVIQQVFHGNSASDCPAGLNFAYTDNSGLLICDMAFDK